MDEGTGIVHIAPGAGGEDFELSRVHDLPVLSPVDESGRFYDDYGWLHGLTTTEAADQIIGRLGETGFLVEAGLFTHALSRTAGAATRRSSSASSDDWFIAVDEIRPTLLDENAKVEWVPEYMGKRMDDWLRNMGDWNISRRRYYGLPLPFYPCSCGHLNIDRVARRARGAGARRARAARGAAPALDRQGPDPLRGVRRAGRADPGGRRRVARRRNRPVRDARVGEPAVGRGGLCDRCGSRVDEGGPSRSRVLGEVVPRRLGLGDARADPAVVLLAVLHVGRARRALAVPARARLREDARRDKVARCTPRGGTRSRPRTRSRGWAPT